MSGSFAVPEDLEPLTRHPKVSPPGQIMRYHHALCYGCGDDAINGLHVAVTAGEGLTSTATMTVRQWMEGGPGVIHGGVLSAAFDEVMGTTALLCGVPVVTGHLEIDFAKPIPIDSSLRFTAEILGKQRRKIYTSATAYIEGPDAPTDPVARSRALFVGIDPRQHFSEHVAKAQRPGEHWSKYSSP
ncbi:MAG: PaaI family thioesterase [Gordonia sp. (in: high G+C Gram-positive bacteria)]|uniref:PaaI family thioesterase n=1 Tax=Gordonia sp. (in: high G+C Gram-positive bacteria) TaxID=84139 RepID=UPI0039E464B1